MGARLRGLALSVVGLALATQADGSPLLHALFQDHAVLQRDQPIVVFGDGAAHETVTVSLASARARTQADATGHWSVTLPAMPAGGPFVLRAEGSSGARQDAADVLVGDVFLCSGQSNMELPVLRAGDSANEISNSANDSIRMLTVPHATSPTPLSDLPDPVTWQTAGPATVPDWSAACFYFGRELQKSIRVPIGLVHSSWGGSNIRPWMSAAALRAVGGYGTALQLLALYATDQTAAQQRFADQWQAWWRARSGDPPGGEPWHVGSSATDPGWHALPALDDWRTWRGAGLEDFTGLVWYRTRFTLTAAQAAGAAALQLGPINQVDETWINGHAVGNTFGYGTERRYPLAAGTLHAGENLLVINVLSTYGGGGLLRWDRPRSLQLAGGASVPLEQPWDYRVVPGRIGYPPRTPWEPVGGMTTIYNAMIAPLGRYGMRGVVWYQGESNTDEADSYQGLLSALMADWRRQFGPGLAYLIVQLPNYGPHPLKPGESGWATVREAERRAAALDGRAGLAVTIDVGDAHNLHPADKQDVGKRLARAARHVVYGEDLAPSGPVPRGAVRRADAVVIDFEGIDEGLVTYSHDTAIGFELCTAAAGSCRYVDARIQGTRIRLQVPDRFSPSRIRYCWADSPICTLFDGGGLPAGPFEIPIGP
ncbi:MAG TPA: sialate O-acetylesterase [Steroidobacteraceae bacterium]|nr:sialate O-acetylesterase [Steroidobacteraceae bacterium]